jgi:hypothetical protein
MVTAVHYDGNKQGSVYFVIVATNHLTPGGISVFARPWSD